MSSATRLALVSGEWADIASAGLYEYVDSSPSSRFEIRTDEQTQMGIMETVSAMTIGYLGDADNEHRIIFAGPRHSRLPLVSPIYLTPHTPAPTDYPETSRSFYARR